MARTYKYQNIKNSVTKMNVESLIEEFNALVGNRSWTSARAAHDAALIDSFIKSGIDVSSVYDGTSISFKHKIALNDDCNKLVIIKE